MSINHMHSDSKKRRSFLTLIFAASDIMGGAKNSYRLLYTALHALHNNTLKHNLLRLQCASTQQSSGSA